MFVEGYQQSSMPVSPKTFKVFRHANVSIEPSPNDNFRSDLDDSLEDQSERQITKTTLCRLSDLDSATVFNTTVPSLAS